MTLRFALVCAFVCVLPASAWATSSPVVVGHVSDAVNLSGTTSVAVSGHYAYTTAYHAGELTAVDISNPAAPAIAGQSAPFLDTNLIGGSNVAISGGDAFVVSKNRNSASTNDDGNGNSLTVLDIQTDPTHPAILGTVRDPNKLFGAYGIAVSGHYAYVAYQGLLSGQPSTPDTSTGGFSVIDLNNLSAGVMANLDNGTLPAPWAGQNLFDHSTAVQVSGHFAYVTAFQSARLTTVDISNPTSPQIVGSVQDATNMAFPADLAVQGNYAYVADQTGGTSAQLTVVNISNPASPVVAGELSNSALNGAYRIRVRGSFAYLSGSGANTISAVDISTPTAPRLAGSVLDGMLLHRTTGLDLDSTGAYVVASSPYSPSEVNATFPGTNGYPDSGPGAPTNTGTISVVSLDPVPVAVTISAASEPPNPTTQTSAGFSFTVNDAVSTVQCSLDGAPLGPCSSSSSQLYSPLGVGSHTFTVVSTDASGHSANTSYSWVVGTPPSNTSHPKISGAAMQGSTLTAALGAWTGHPTPTLSDRWERCNRQGAACLVIPGATGRTYIPKLGDVGSTLRLAVKASNSLGSASTQSGPTAVVVSNALASFTGVKRGAASLHITVTGAGHGAGVKQITVGLPSTVMRFLARRRLAANVFVRNSHNKLVRAQVTLRSGSLVITLRTPATSVHIVIGGALFEIKNSFSRSARHKKKLTATVVLTVAETQGVVTHDKLSARVT